MYQQQREKYLENTVNTATPAQLLLMLYDGAIRFLKLGIEAIKRKNIEEANNNLCKVQRIIHELMATLDKSAPVSEGLLQLYDYFNRRLIEANVQKNTEPAEEVLGFLVELRETWAQAAKKTAGMMNHVGSC